MTFLPIVERELRVAARKRSTFWIRVAAALFALVLGSGFLVLSLAPIGRSQLGAWLFMILTYLSLAAALAAGLFFTADCLSEEKREGTLGFLFLTDLRGHDVVLGKLLATSLRAFFALLAIFPILAVTFVMGGVESGQFWKTMLALVNALFFSLAAGMFVSALSHDSQRALGGTILLLLGILVGGPISDTIIAMLRGLQNFPVFNLLSPAYAFNMASNWSPLFWKSLIGSHLAGWTFLGLACFLIPRTWQVKASRTAGKLSRSSYWWRYGGAERRMSLRRKLLGRNPILWLMSRERWQGTLVWAVSVTLFVLVLAAILLRVPAFFWLGWGTIGGVFVWIFYLGAASQAPRFFVDAQRSGLLEVLLATPLDGKEIVQGQWRALARMFGWAIALFLGVHLAAGSLSQNAVFGQVSSGNSGLLAISLMVLTTGFAVMTVAGNIIALTWFGMWMGMTSKNASMATLKTLLFVQILPGFVIGFLGVITTAFWLMPMLADSSSNSATGMIASFPTIYAGITMLLSLAKDVGLCIMARRKLYRDFREMAVRSVAPVRVPTMKPAATPPPVIGAQI